MLTMSTLLEFQILTLLASAVVTVLLIGCIGKKDFSDIYSDDDSSDIYKNDIEYDTDYGYNNDSD